MQQEKEKPTGRLSITPSAFELFRSFARGVDLEYSDVLKLIVEAQIRPGESPLAAGERFKAELGKGKQ